MVGFDIKLGNEERYVDSNRMRQMIKKGLAETKGLREGEKWECRPTHILHPSLAAA